MKKNKLLNTVLCTMLASASLLTACQDNGEFRGTFTPEEESTPTPTEAPEITEPDGTEGGPEAVTPTPTPTPVPAAADVPELVCSSRYRNFDVDNNGYDLLLTYELLHTDVQYGKAHPGLRDALEEIADLVDEATGETCSGYAEILSGMSDKELKNAMDMGDYPKYYYNRVYTRRADEKILSFMYENRYFDFNDEYDDVRISGYNFYVEDGSEVKFSDVVADEEAFYDLLSGKLTVTVHDELEVMQDYPVDADRTRKEMLEYMDKGQYAWVLEPQGISFYFDTFTFMPWVASATVLFSEDTEGKIFTDEFRTDVPDEWVMKLPKYRYTVFDAEDDGESDTIWVYDITDPDQHGEYYFNYIIGSSILYNGKSTEITDDAEEQPYDYESYLVHKDGKTVLLVLHCEYDYDYMDTYTISGSGIKHAEGYEGGVEFVPEDDWIWGDEVNSPKYVITGSSGIPVYTVLNPETWDCSYGRLSIGSDGKFTVVSK